MKRLDTLKNKWPLISLLVLYMYLIFHAISGSEGIIGYLEYEKKINITEEILLELSEDRKKLEKHAVSLNSSELDLDKLDIKARQLLFVSDPNEKTIWLDHK
ncbi:septum formation initiator family protein [Hellea sp.]|nr:septum formation initiator family protein [Hellea sp.]MDA8887891.1 septum formation initiator family protein [Hellea sp.]MDB4845223.1 septum formation initiator family protein [Hellea sp.]MDC0650833.1 septum formation initiator family protein [Hellea sp.]MDC1062300.1 septum formation initiator family protein [Hellea sp.]